MVCATDWNCRYLSQIAFLLLMAMSGQAATALGVGLSGGFFEPNRGQAQASVRFVWQGPQGLALLEDSQVIFPLRPGNPSREQAHAHRSIRFLGSSAAGQWSVEKSLSGKSNYLIGHKNRWVTNLENYARIRQSEIYPGIDVVWYGNSAGELEFDLIVHAGADPSQIELHVSNGAPHRGIASPEGASISLRPPVAFQTIDDVRKPVDVAYLYVDDGRIRLRIGEYDPRVPLVIDPVVLYSTYLGGASTEIPTDLAVDADGNVFVIGLTQSVDFPTRNALQASSAGGDSDLFVAKFDPQGARIYSTYLGGTGGDDIASISIAPGGGVYIGGCTSSADFPLAKPFQAQFQGIQNAVLLRLDRTGSQLEFSTYLGGAITERGTGAASCIRSIATDERGRVVVSGVTSAIDFPTKRALQGQFGGGLFDSFIGRFLEDGTLDFSTFLGGADLDGGAGITFDTKGNLVATGTTSSTDFPTTRSAFMPEYPGGFRAGYVVKLQESGSSLIFSTFLGGAQHIDTRISGNGDDNAEAVAVDAHSGSVWIAGVTRSIDFPVTRDAFQREHNAADLANPTPGQTADAFVTQLSANGRKLIYSSYFGGIGGDQAAGIAALPKGGVVVAGSTGSPDFPLVNALDTQIGGNTDAFVCLFEGRKAQLTFSSFFGGSASEAARSVEADQSSAVYIVGDTTSDDFPTHNPAQAMYRGGSDAFVSKIIPVKGKDR